MLLDGDRGASKDDEGDFRFVLFDHQKLHEIIKIIQGFVCLRAKINVAGRSFNHLGRL